ncbi:MAG: flavodoxin domain-containing protein [Lachnospiraceae bacterium]|jgi:flavorubredoxin|nr:flavodoxin [Lachnospiraceae bacterium]MCH4030028.1 flavodoxin [Lachnospiraceae bacterium]MCH4070312.1 flavodoxin [Lachnospiraceae bacterium]MCH4107824.1 flavodoxin [Lachnospiraceae bacterium]MCI1361479.1 flavodoxin [Lachnospiraceae bacterium]
MSAAVRYYSRSGNTKLLAEAIAKGAGVTAVSADAPDAALAEPVDVLFIGGALYAYGLDKNLKNYLKSFDPSKAKKAVVFSTSWISRHALDLIANSLKSKNIPVEKEVFYAKGRPDDVTLKKAEEFGARMAGK